jgi:hypothetical protein
MSKPVAPTSYKSFSEWCQLNAGAALHLTIQGEESLHTETNRRVPFSEQRSTLHGSITRELLAFARRLEEEGMTVFSALQECQPVNIDVPQPVFRHSEANMLCRLCGHMQLKHARLIAQWLSKKSFAVMEKQTETNALLALYEGGMIPDDIAVSLSPSFTKIQFPEPPPKSLKSQMRLQNAITSIRLRIRNFRAPIWAAEFPLFLKSLVNEIEFNLIDATCYCKPRPHEVSFSQALLDAKLALVPDYRVLLECPRPLFAKKLLEVIDTILADRITNLNRTELAIAHFVFFRNLFDLCFVQRRDLWASAPPELISKVDQIAKFPPTSFKLPDFVVLPPPRPGENIADYIRGDPGFAEAARILTLAAFASNPLDALFYVYLALTEIKTRASVDLKDLEALSFDDTFLLFFVVFLSSDLIDLFALARFVADLGPKQLSPVFEYSKMMLDSLLLHVTQLDPSSLHDPRRA